MQNSPLSEKKFEALVKELNRLMRAADEAASTEKALGYWKVGERIATERLSEEAGYHNSVLADVAHALGVSGRTLQRSVAFHHAYKRPPQDGLSWMHYQILSSLGAKKERTFYQSKAANDAWTVRQLRDAIRADLFEGGSPEPKKRGLARPSFLDYCYLARAEHIVDGDTLDLDVDLGFRSWTKQRIRLSHLNAPEANSRAGRAAKNFIAQQLARAKTIVIKSQKSDIYGRFLADVFLSAEDVSLKACFETGRYLNDLLVRHGHATAL